MYSTGISSTLGASHVEVLAAALLRPAVMSMHFCAFLLWFFWLFPQVVSCWLAHTYRNISAAPVTFT